MKIKEQVSSPPASDQIPLAAYPVQDNGIKRYWFMMVVLCVALVCCGVLVTSSRGSQRVVSTEPELADHLAQSLLRESRRQRLAHLLHDPLPTNVTQPALHSLPPNGIDIEQLMKLFKAMVGSAMVHRQHHDAEHPDNVVIRRMVIIRAMMSPDGHKCEHPLRRTVITVQRLMTPEGTLPTVVKRDLALPAPAPTAPVSVTAPTTAPTPDTQIPSPPLVQNQI